MGPYSPVTPQPLALLLRLRGETVAGVEPPDAGYCRRGIAALVEGASVEAALPIVERSCSFAGAAHREALCRAVEAATNTTLTRPARLTRVLFLETERVLARLWNLGLAAQGFGLSELWALALDQREDLFGALEAGTGNRRYWGVAAPGGVRADLDLEPLRAALVRLDTAVAPWRAAVASQGALGRAGKGVATLSAERATALGLAGLAASASTDEHDGRREERDTDYAGLGVEWPASSSSRTGDVAGRLAAAVDEIATSLAIAKACLGELPAGAGAAAAPVKYGRGEQWLSAAVAGPHGPVALFATLTAAGTLTGFRLDTPATAVLNALPEVLEGRLLGQAPATLASLDLCVECLDQ